MRFGAVLAVAVAFLAAFLVLRREPAGREAILPTAPRTESAQQRAVALAPAEAPPRPSEDETPASPDREPRASAIDRVPAPPTDASRDASDSDAAASVEEGEEEPPHLGRIAGRVMSDPLRPPNRVRFDRVWMSVCEDGMQAIEPDGYVDLLDRQVDDEGGLAQVLVRLKGEGVTSNSPGRRGVRIEGCRFATRVTTVAPGGVLSVRDDRVEGGHTLGHRGTWAFVLPPDAEFPIPPGEWTYTSLEGTSEFIFDSSAREASPNILAAVVDGSDNPFVVEASLHPWMKLHCFVEESRSTVTDEHGRFAFEDLEPGYYELTTWHELLGEGVLAEELYLRPGESLDLGARWIDE